MFEIKPVREHFEVFYNGKFFCSADTESEAESEIKNYTAIIKSSVQKALWNTITGGSKANDI